MNERDMMILWLNGTHIRATGYIRRNNTSHTTTCWCVNGTGTRRQWWDCQDSSTCRHSINCTGSSSITILLIIPSSSSLTSMIKSWSSLTLDCENTATAMESRPRREISERDDWDKWLPVKKKSYLANSLWITILWAPNVTGYSNIYTLNKSAKR